MDVPERYLLKVAVNLYYISYEIYPDYGNEIDLLEAGLSSSNEGLDSFCNLFMKMVLQKNYSCFVSWINCIPISNVDRLFFFKKCCMKEIELIKSGELPTIFYWDDYPYYKKYGFEYVVELSFRKQKKILSVKKQIGVVEAKNSDRKSVV